MPKGQYERCEYGDGCRRKAVDTHNGKPICSPCKLQASLTGKAKKAKGTQAFGASIRPLDLIPDEWPAKTCGCGCGESIKRPRGFRPGHDAKLKSRLKKEGLL